MACSFAGKISNNLKSSGIEICSNNCSLLDFWICHFALDFRESGIAPKALQTVFCFACFPLEFEDEFVAHVTNTATEGRPLFDQTLMANHIPVQTATENCGQRTYEVHKKYPEKKWN